VSKWPSLELGEVLRHRKEFFQIDDALTYRRCRVQLHAQGIVLRDEVQGFSVKTKEQQACRAGEFLVAEIDAKVGGYGIVPGELDGAVVSSHYFLFEFDSARLDRRFLAYFIRTPAFRDQVSAHGSTNYAAIRPAHVLGYKIPLPPFDEQQRIITRIEQLEGKVNSARRLRTEASTTTDRLLSTETTRVYASIGHHPVVSLGSLGPDGANPIQTGPFGAQLHASDFVEAGVPVLNVGNVWPDGLRLTNLDHVTEQKAAVLTRYSLEPDDLLFARSGATLGKVCLVPDDCRGWLMTGHLFRVRLDQTRCDPRFVFAGLRAADSVRGQVFDLVRGATRPGFNTSLLSMVTIPLPPLAEQRQIVEHLVRYQAKVGALKTVQSRVAAELDALLPAVLDRAFRGDL
jgi:type I restriction enzyme S subunit